MSESEKYTCFIISWQSGDFRLFSLKTKRENSSRTNWYFQEVDFMEYNDLLSWITYQTFAIRSVDSECGN